MVVGLRGAGVVEDQGLQLLLKALLKVMEDGEILCENGWKKDEKWL